MGKGAPSKTTSTTISKYEPQYYELMQGYLDLAQQQYEDESAFQKQNVNPYYAAYYQTALSQLPEQAAVTSAQLALEKAQANAGQQLLPLQTGAQGEQYRLAQEQASAERGLVGQNTATQRSQLQLAQAQADANKGLVPQSTDTQRAQLIYQQGQAQAGSELLPYQTQLEKGQLQNAIANQPQENRIYQGRLGLQENSLGQTAELAKGFLDASLNGVNREEWANRAGYDQQKAADQANEQLARNASRMGLSPTSGAFTQAMANQSAQNAANIATARTQGYRAADDENYRRKQQGLQAGLGLIGG